MSTSAINRELETFLMLGDDCKEIAYTTVPHPVKGVYQIITLAISQGSETIDGEPRPPFLTLATGPGDYFDVSPTEEKISAQTVHDLVADDVARLVREAHPGEDPPGQLATEGTPGQLPPRTALPPRVPGGTLSEQPERPRKDPPSPIPRRQGTHVWEVGEVRDGIKMVDIADVEQDDELLVGGRVLDPPKALREGQAYYIRTQGMRHQTIAAGRSVLVVVDKSLCARVLEELRRGAQ